MSDIIQKYIDHGMVIVRVRKESKRPVDKWKTTGSINPDVIRGWLDAGYNIAADLGKSGMIAPDVDTKEGQEFLDSLNVPLETFTTKTGKGGSGRHYFYKSNKKYETKIKAKPGLDLLAGVRIAILPPSIHPDTKKPYEIINDMEPVEAPLWLEDLFEDADNKPDPIKTIKKAKKNGKVAYFTYSGGDIPQGERQPTLFKTGCSFRAKGSDHDDILIQLENINETKCKPPLDKKEIEKIAHDVCRYTIGLNGDYVASIYTNADNSDLTVRGNIFEYFRKTASGDLLAKYILLYLAISQVSSLNNGEKIFNYTAFMKENYGLSMNFTPKAMRYFQEIGLLNIIERKSLGKYSHKDIEFTPNNFNGGK